MENYREYPIRCKSCGGQIACYTHAFELALTQNYTSEAALNELGLTDYCCRMAMLNPVMVAFNMENRQVIEGFKSIDAVQDEDIELDSRSQPIFDACLVTPTEPAPRPRLQGGPAKPGMFSRYIKNSPQLPETIAATSAGTVSESSYPRIDPIHMEVQISGVNQPIGPAVDVITPIEEAYHPPTVVGIPTINPDRTIPETWFHVGANKQSRVLNGRTFLAR